MVTNLRFFYKPKLVARIPFVTKRKIEIIKNFFENNFVSVKVFINISGYRIFIIKTFRERFPNSNLIVEMNLKNRFASSNIGRFGNFIISIIWKKRKFGIFTTSRKSTVTRNKHPMV